MNIVKESKWQRIRYMPATPLGEDGASHSRLTGRAALRVDQIPDFHRNPSFIGKNGPVLSYRAAVMSIRCLCDYSSPARRL